LIVGRFASISLGTLVNTSVGGIDSSLVGSSTTQTFSTASHIVLFARAEARGNLRGKAGGLSGSGSRLSSRIASLSSNESGEAKREDDSRELHFD